MNLNQVTVPSVDLVRSIAFYEKLGLKLIVKALPNYARFECPEGDATFSIHKADELAEGDGIMVYFECQQLDAYVDKLIAKGIVFDEMPNDKRWIWREARLRDPDDNQLVLYYAGKNRKNPPWRIV
jgi:catechol 2,3-dioxygenase-like lactoylglutathione lyase family enzyme